MTVLEFKPLLVHNANSRDVLNLSLTWNILTCLDDDHLKWGREQLLRDPHHPAVSQSLCPVRPHLTSLCFPKVRLRPFLPPQVCTIWETAPSALEAEEQQALVLSKKPPSFSFLKYIKKCDLEGTVPSQSTPSAPQPSHFLWQSSCALIRRLSQEAQSSGENGEESALLKRVLPPGLRSAVAYSLRIRADCLPVVNLLQQCSFPVYRTLETLWPAYQGQPGSITHSLAPFPSSDPQKFCSLRHLYKQQKRANLGKSRNKIR